MARKTDDLADSFATEETGGWLTRLLADEEELNTQDKWRLGSWAIASLGAVVLAIMAVQNVTDRRREQTAAADVAQQSQMIQRLAKDTQTATSRLTAAIESLNTDRDRLYARVGTLEQGLDSVTGSIARVQSGGGKPNAPAAANPIDRWGAAATLPEIPTKETPPPAPPVAPVETRPNTPAAPTKKLGAIEPSPTAAAPAASPAVAATVPVTLAPTKPEEPASAQAPAAAEAKKPSDDKAMAEKPQERSRLDKPRLEPAPPERPAAQTAAAMISTTPLMPSRSILAPPDPGAAKLLEPKAATSPEETGEDAEAAAETPAPRTDFGVDLGAANTVEGLRGLWRKLSKTQKSLKGLQPIIMIKENGNATQLRLVAGPIADAAAAAKVCAALGSADRACEASVYDGQRLPMAAPASAPQAAPQRPVRRHRERVTLQQPEPPPPPPAQAQDAPPPPRPATLSSFLGIR
ncbi:SPOR domain-containing protein [Rhodopseudomonas palustris]|uniref:SPOR domain-containing protein n=1 Tax=Rhodopseudomonas palustris TaxID=1076 RepID=UPI000E5BB573|nr:SPOR domain-containing protein [Rhodopseudomonas palustris]QLH71693.1 SPOR domain-containing protein [Rhodopseudomonas palustris]RHZ91878.1 sporulation protein [Rhodopseudomonas palustris]